MASTSTNYSSYGTCCSVNLVVSITNVPSDTSVLLEGNLVVRTGAGYFKAVAAGMKLEQSIQRSKKRPGNIGKTKQQTRLSRSP